MKRWVRSAGMWLALLAGCEAGVPEYDGSLSVAAPELAPIAPGVQVVEFAAEPMFFADGFYWLYRDGVWLRSDSYKGGFAPIDRNLVPNGLLRLPRPEAYAHYRR